MSLNRAAGVLLHVSSLPGSFGAGDFGPAAYRFADFLASAGFSVWQVLPMTPVGAAFGYQTTFQRTTAKRNKLNLLLRSQQLLNVLQRLAAADGNKSEASRRLGISRKTMDRKCQAWGL